MRRNSNRPSPAAVITSVTRKLSQHFLSLLLIGLSSLLWQASAAANEADEHPDESVFLVATDQLQGSSFARTVILMTHFGGRGGTTGLAINRPSAIALKDAFPTIPRLQKSRDRLYLGGPVSTQSVFVLQRSDQPVKGMMHLIKDIYFSPSHRVLALPLSGERRAYAGYVGWAPGQLQREIDRGDWQVIRNDPGIVFEADTSGLWQQLSRSWIGDWI